MGGRSDFSIFKRRTKDRASGKSVVRYCVRFYDPESRQVIKTKTLEATSAARAGAEARELFEKGVGSSAGDPLLIDFLKDFWTAKPTGINALRKQKRSPLYLYISNNTIHKYWEPYLNGLRLHAVTVDRIERIIERWSEDGFPRHAINSAIKLLKIAIKEWSRKNRIPNPLQYLDPVDESPRERGVLSEGEVKKVIALQGQSPRVKAAVLLGALCGLRLGEVRGLQWEDVDEKGGILHVKHNWIDREGLKGPKCGSYRDVPLPDIVLKELKLCRDIPHPKTAFVIFNERFPNHADGPAFANWQFHDLLGRIGIDEEQRKKRNIVFHSLRHTFVSLNRLTLPDFVVQHLVGHSSMATTEGYTHVDEHVIDFAAAKKAMDKRFTTKGKKAITGIN